MKTERHFFSRGLLAAAIWAVAAVPQLSAQDSRELRVASFVSDRAGVVKNALVPFIEAVIEEAGPTLSAQYFFGGTLGRNPAEQLKLVADGVADIVIVAPSYMPGELEDFGVAELPGLSSSTVLTSQALWRAVETGLIATPDGVVILAAAINGQNEIHLKPAIDSLDGLAGLKIRTAGAGQASIIEGLGGISVPAMPGSAVAESIATGVIDGTVMSWSGLEAFQVKRVTSTHVAVPLGSLVTLIVMNKDVWDDLAPAQRAAFENHAGEAFSRLSAEVMFSADNDVRADVSAREGEVNVPLGDADNARIAGLMATVAAEWIGGDAARQQLYDDFLALIAQEAGN